MKAIVQHRYGSTEVLELSEIEVPAVGEDEVLIRVHAAGVNPADWHFMTGLPYPIRFVSGFGTQKRPVRGLDVAGTVQAVGSAVTRFRPGDEVLGVARGSFAEYATANHDRLVLKPARLSFVQAASLPIAGCAALHAVDAAGITPGQELLVIGAAGGIGTTAVQLAAALGARVTGVCSTGKVELVRSIGAQRVIDYTREDIVGAFDAIIDTAGGRALSSLRAALAADGTLVIVGSEGGGKVLGGMGRSLAASALSRFVAQNLVMLSSQETAEDLARLVEAVERGTLIPVIDRTYPLAEAAEAIRHLEQGRAAGKVVITVVGES